MLMEEEIDKRRQVEDINKQLEQEILALRAELGDTKAAIDERDSEITKLNEDIRLLEAEVECT